MRSQRERHQDRQGAPLASQLPINNPAQPASLAPSRAASPDWLARGLIILFGLLLTWYSWAHWGDLQIDCGRELYVPLSILKGKLLYRDLWYPYGPLTPYLQALIFYLFGAGLTTSYVFGISLTLVTALLLYTIAGRFLPTAGCLLVSLVFLLQGLRPSIFNYIFPYSYAAVLGLSLSLWCLYFAIRHIRNEAWPNLLLAGLFAGAALICKQEFGLACYCLLAVVLFWPIIFGPRSTGLGRDLLLCAPGLAISILVYGWFIWMVSAKVIFFDNFQLLPGSYFMQTFGAKWLADRGLRFVPGELLATFLVALAAAAFWYLAAAFVGYSLRRHSLLPWGALITALLIVVYYDPATVAVALRLIHAMVFPTGMFWLSAVVFFAALVGLPRTASPSARFAEAALAACAIALGVRIMVQVRAAGYAIYYDVPLYLVFILVLTRAIGWATSSLATKQRALCLVWLLGLQGAWLGLVLFPRIESLPGALITPLGKIYTKPSEAAQFPRIISFMQRQKALGKRVIVLPQAPSLYYFSGTEAPMRWYELVPGLLSAKQEQEFIAQAESASIDFVLVSNLSSFEWGTPYFGFDYNRRIYRWIEDNYDVIGEFGHFARRRDAPFAMLVYRRRGRKAEPVPSGGLEYERLESGGTDRWPPGPSG